MSLFDGEDDFVVANLRPESGDTYRSKMGSCAWLAVSIGKVHPRNKTSSVKKMPQFASAAARRVEYLRRCDIPRNMKSAVSCAKLLEGTSVFEACIGPSLSCAIGKV
jgi:hypothetical protein